MKMSEAVRELERLIAEVGDLPLCFDRHGEATHVENFEHREDWVTLGSTKWTTPAYIDITGYRGLDRIEEEIRTKDEFSDVKKIPCRLSDLEVRDEDN